MRLRLDRFKCDIPVPAQCLLILLVMFLQRQTVLQTVTLTLMLCIHIVHCISLFFSYSKLPYLSAPPPSQSALPLLLCFDLGWLCLV